MEGFHGRRKKRRRAPLARTIGSTVVYGVQGLLSDGVYILREGRLFLGTALIVLGALSFASDRYCDGTASTHFACTRPTTYYYYPWWAILFVILGTFLVLLWWLRTRES